jgi:hypothetical protein
MSRVLEGAMTTIPFAFLRPPGCFTSSDACELLIAYPGGRISHYRNTAGEAHETFLALPQAGGRPAVLIWKDPGGTYFRGALATLEVAASGRRLADVMPAEDVEAQVGERRRHRPIAEGRATRPVKAPGLGTPVFA